MILCSCAVITDHDIEAALIEILSQPDAPIPTPGVVYRHLGKRMNCCGCAPLAVDTIYAKMEKLERLGLVCPCACASARTRLGQVTARQPRTVRNGRSRSRSALRPVEAAAE